LEFRPCGGALAFPPHGGRSAFGTTGRISLKSSLRRRD
jgi:hypothetical protein